MTTETKVQHTPGPWETSCMAGHDPDDPDSEQAQWTIVAEGGGDMIADLADTEAWLPREVVQANAHLIAAAPALLESLEAMTSQLEESNKRLEGLDSLLLENMGKPKQGELGEIIRSRPVLRQARQAIALAKGNRMPSATHDCGLCDGPLVFAGMEGEYATYTCKECEWWHITKDCCEWACGVRNDL